MARKASPEPDFDRELADLPPELRWREWKARVEAVLFAAPKPVTREVLVRVIGRDCVLDLLLDDLREDLRGRPVELVRAGEGFALHTRAAFGPAVRFGLRPSGRRKAHKTRSGRAHGGRHVPAGDPRGNLGNVRARDLARSDRCAAPGWTDRRRSPQPETRAPYTYVTTETFLVEFGFESLRHLPDLEALKDAGLMPAAGRLRRRDRESEADDAGDRLAPPEASQDSAA